MMRAIDQALLTERIVYLRHGETDEFEVPESRYGKKQVDQKMWERRTKEKKIIQARQEQHKPRRNEEHEEKEKTYFMRLSSCSSFLRGKSFIPKLFALIYILLSRIVLSIGSVVE